MAWIAECRKTCSNRSRPATSPSLLHTRIRCALSALWAYWRIPLKDLPEMLGLKRSPGRFWRLTQGATPCDVDEAIAVIRALTQALNLRYGCAWAWASGAGDAPQISDLIAARMFHPAAREMAAIRRFLNACDRAGARRTTYSAMLPLEFMPEAMRRIYLESLYPVGSKGAKEAREAVTSLSTESEFRFYAGHCREQHRWRLILPYSAIARVWHGYWPFSEVPHDYRREAMERLLFDGVAEGRLALSVADDHDLPDQYPLGSVDEITAIGRDTVIRRPSSSQIHLVYDTAIGPEAAQVVVADQAMLSRLMVVAKPITFPRPTPLKFMSLSGDARLDLPGGVYDAD